MSTMPIPQTTQPATKPLVVLVDDHEDTRQMYSEFLADAFDVRTAADGAEALAFMSERRPDVLVTDLSLPDIDGFELVLRVRRDPVLRDVPVICLSGYGGEEHERRAREVGFDRVIQKPCLPDALSAAAAELVQRQGVRGGAA